MKINLLNKSFFTNNKTFLNNIEKSGMIIESDVKDDFNNIKSILHNNKDDNLDSENNLVHLLYDYPIEELSDKKIIINDCDCSDSFYNEVCSFLQEKGLNIIESRNSSNINIDDSIVITLDQQYNSGVPSIVFAPFNNSRLGDADALVLSTYYGLKQNGIILDDIASNKTGFRVQDDGSISNMIPTETEDMLDTSVDNSFVTISLGSQKQNPKDIALGIESAIARYYNYLNYHNIGSDLIYRALPLENIEIIANYFDVDQKDLREFNNLDNQNVLSVAKTIINPKVKNINSFSSCYDFTISEEKNKNILK